MVRGEWYFQNNSGFVKTLSSCYWLEPLLLVFYIHITQAPKSHIFPILNLITMIVYDCVSVQRKKVQKQSFFFFYFCFKYPVLDFTVNLTLLFSQQYIVPSLICVRVPQGVLYMSIEFCLDETGISWEGNLYLILEFIKVHLFVQQIILYTN